MHSHIVVGLAFGDEGKGSWVDHLCRRHNINTVVRFNGGAQALHHVTTEDGRTHGFSQFGSHSFIPGAKTMLSRYTLIDPRAIRCEATLAGLPMKKIFISDEAPVVPKTNQLLNQIMEQARGDARHGSCGYGIGLTQRDIDQGDKPVIRAGDLKHRSLFAQKLSEHLVLTLEEAKQYLHVAHMKYEDHPDVASPFEQLMNYYQLFDRYVDWYCELAQLVNIIPEAAFLSTLRRTPAVFEGAQGAMLDQAHGTFPHCTRSTTTPENALMLLSDAGFMGDVTRHGLFRAYGTRHGAGPFPTEVSGIDIPGCDNRTGEWQGAFRTGWFDTALARTALQFSEVDEVVLTNLDRLNGLPELKVATAYGNMSKQYYHRGKNRLMLVGDYDESAARTSALFDARPVYESLAGYVDEFDTNQENYIRFIEEKIGKTITALSRRKDHHKVYR